jgi:predicted phosphoribosyltransferase
MGQLIQDATLRDRTRVFRDRTDAGRRLAAWLTGYQGRDVRLFAIPAGGVPVAAEIARSLGLPLDLIIVRKIQLPWTTEAGFGALDPEGRAIFNEELVVHFHLSPQAIEAQVQKTLATLKEREARLRGGKPYPELAGRPVIVVDDGLASGYTMRAALRFLQEKGAGDLIVAVPTGSQGTVQALLPHVDLLVCLNLRGGWSFAVADAYENWYDLTEKEVLAILAGLPAAPGAGPD